MRGTKMPGYYISSLTTERAKADVLFMIDYFQILILPQKLVGATAHECSELQDANIAVSAAKSGSIPLLPRNSQYLVHCDKL